MIFIRKQNDTWVTQAQQQGCICQTGGTPSLRMRHPAVLWERIARHHHTVGDPLHTRTWESMNMKSYSCYVHDVEADVADVSLYDSVV